MIDEILSRFLGEEIVRERLRPPPVPRFAAETVRPAARAVVAIATAAALSVGCAPSEEESHPNVCGGRFALGEGVDARIAESAREDWNTWLGREAVTFAPGAPCVIRMGALDGTLGARYDASGTITLDPEADDATRAIRHEIGHSLGMRHVQGPAVMARSNPEASDWFTSTDEAEAKWLGLFGGAR